MSSIDERVVEMKFNNGQFLNGVKGTLEALGLLKKGLNLDDSKQSLDGLSEAGRRFNLDNMALAVDNIQSKFSILGAVGFSAIQSLTNSAIDFGKKIAGSMLDPLVEGGKKRALNIEQARFQFLGLGMDVEASMQSALDAVKGTAFGLDEAAVVAAQFGASGMEAGEDMTAALRGISGVAAMAGSSYSDIGNVFTKVAGQGRLMGDDLNRLATRGVNAAATLGESMGKTEEEVRSMVTKGEIDFQTFASAMNEAFGEHATKANDTYTGSLSNMRAALARIGADVATSHFESMRRVFNALTPVIDEVKDAIQPVLDALGELMTFRGDALVGFLEGLDLTAFKEAVPLLVDAGRNILGAITSIVKPIRDAFTEIIPPITGTNLIAFAQGIKDFTEGLSISGKTAENLKRTFRGVFAVFDIAWMVVKGLAGVIFDLVGALTAGSGGVLDFTGGIGDFLVSLRDAIKSGEGLSDFFSGLSRVLTAPINLLRDLAGWLRAALGGGIDSEGAAEAVDRLKNRLRPLHAASDALRGLWQRLGDTFEGVWEFFRPMAQAMSEFFQGIGSAITDSVSDMDFSQILDGISVGLLGGITLMLRNFLKGGINVDLGGGFLESLKGIFGGVTETLSAMQAQLRAGTLLKIAGAIAVLAASVAVLSLIDPARLASALGALTVMFVQLGGAMALIDRVVKGPGFAKLPIIAASMILLATAALILSIAVKRLADLEWEELAKGLAGVAGLLIALAGASKLMSGNTGALVRTGASLILVALAIKILVSAVEDFSAMNWADMAKGFAGVTAALVAMGLFTKLVSVNRGALKSSVGLVILAGALKLIASAVKDFAGMDWATMGRGFAGMAGSLLLIAGAVALLPKSLPITAAGLVIIAGALVILAQALSSMGGMSWEEIGKGLTVLAGSLLILVGALYLMSGAIVGAAALIVVAGALAILTPVLIALGGMSWEEIGMGLAALAGALLVLGLAGLAMTPVVPTLLLLGAAITLMGVGLAAAGIGITALAMGLTALGAAAGVGAAAIVAIGAAIIGLIPAAMVALASGLVQMVGVLVAAAPQFLVAAVVLITTLLDAIDQVAPKIIKTLTNLIMNLLKAIEKMVPQFISTATVVIMTLLDAINIVGPRVIETLANLIVTLVDTILGMVPQFVTSGMEMIIGILDGIASNIGDIITAGTDIIVSLLQGIQENYPRIIDEGIQTIVTFVQGLADGIRNNQAAMNRAGRDLASAIADGLTGGLASKVGDAARSAANWARGALDGAKRALGIASPSKEFVKIGKYVNDGFVKGLRGNSSQVQAAYNQMRDNLRSFIKASNEQVKKAQENLKKLEAARKKDNAQLRKNEKLNRDKSDKSDSARAARKKARLESRELRKSIAEQNKAVAKEKANLKALTDERSRAQKALTGLNKDLNDETAKLKKYSDQQEVLTEKIKDANKELEDAIKTRDDYNRSITDSYSSLESVTKDTKLEDYMENLRVKIGDTVLFATRLQKLRDQGLNDKLYRDLLGKGVDALPFVDQILEGGKSSVKELNKLTDQLDKEAGKLGKSASAELYQAGVDMARGIVEGLKKQEKNLQAQMDKLADTIVNGVKRRLKIKSPSQVFAEIGEDTAKGLIVGLNKTSDAVGKASSKVGNSAISGLKDSMSNLGTAMLADIDMSPTIRPVLDLSDVKKGSGLIDGLLGPSSISPTSSYNKAATLAVEERAMQEALAEQLFNAQEMSKTEISYVQNNHSPKALSEAEIYRQTRNQLSVVKGGLPK